MCSVIKILNFRPNEIKVQISIGLGNAVLVSQLNILNVKFEMQFDYKIATCDAKKDPNKTLKFHLLSLSFFTLQMLI